MSIVQITQKSLSIVHRIFKGEKETIFLTYSIKLAVEILDDPNGRNPATSNIATICSTTKRKKNTCYPFFPPEFLYPSILDTRCTHLEAIIEGARERRGGERGGKEGWRARGRVAKKGGERKREFSRPSFAFYPPRSGSKSREPLSHRLLDACKYPWQRGTTMRGDPRRELFLRISGWSAQSLPKISRREERKKEARAFGKNFLLIRHLFLPFLNSFPLSREFTSTRANGGLLLETIIPQLSNRFQFFILNLRNCLAF